MKSNITVGACFRDSANFWSEWRVDRIYADPLGLPHAIVVNLSDPTERRTIACPTLGDRRRFEPINGARRPWTPPASASAVDVALAGA
jgi:hypothetical protein